MPTKMKATTTTTKVTIVIYQIIPSQWKSDDGSIQTSVLGLGSNNKIYRWSKQDCKWHLWTSVSKKPRNVVDYAEADDMFLD